MGNITVWSQFTHSHINIYESYLHCCRSVKWLNRYVLLLFYMCWQSSDEKITHNLWLRRKNYVYCGGIMVTSVWGLYFTLMLLLLFVYWNPVMRKQLINSDFIVKITLPWRYYGDFCLRISLCTLMLLLMCLNSVTIKNMFFDVSTFMLSMWGHEISAREFNYNNTLCVFDMMLLYASVFDFLFGDDKKYVLRRFNIYVVNVGSWDFCPRTVFEQHCITLYIITIHLFVCII